VHAQDTTALQSLTSVPVQTYRTVWLSSVPFLSMLKLFLWAYNSLSFVMYFSSSVYSNATTGLPLKGFWWNFMLGIC